MQVFHSKAKLLVTEPSGLIMASNTAHLCFVMQVHMGNTVHNLVPKVQNTGNPKNTIYHKN